MLKRLIDLVRGSQVPRHFQADVVVVRIEFESSAVTGQGLAVVLQLLEYLRLQQPCF